MNQRPIKSCAVKDGMFARKYCKDMAFPFKRILTPLYHCQCKA